ncbi:MAG: glycosyltransferase [Candidatus Omnitrophica bacterium]|nr:glycosyltransferase [Candidatus Omnitrophota bacterium]MBI2174433.1 glycosyltransferase [Candidatus Omnitrophota bacterium]MBI3009955.1 glycosyltransferase [Candidatus Omnitrophota bacterium]
MEQNGSPTIWVSYVTAGAGHRRAAEAIAQEAARLLPQAHIVCQDLLEFVPRWFRRSYPKAYYLLVRHAPILWGWAFDWLNDPAVYGFIQPIRRVWNRWMARRFIDNLRRHQPEVVIVTHFFSADVISSCKRAGWLKSSLVVVITDLYPHRFWLSMQAQAYVCATELTAAVVQSRGIPLQQLHVLGIPIAPAFRLKQATESLRAGFQLRPGYKTVLVTAGGRTVGPFIAVVKSLLFISAQAAVPFQLLVVCGDDPATERYIHRLSWQTSVPIQVFGFIDTMAQAMAVSDLIVMKAGGLTMSEALGCGLPGVVYHAIPGQERANADYVVKYGAAVLAIGPAAASQATRQLLENPGRLEEMRVAASRLGRADAAEQIILRVVKPLLEKQ